MPLDRALAPLAARFDPYRGPADDPPTPREGRLASVAVILRPGSPAAASGAPILPALPVADLELLFIRRALSEPDPWSGHLAFPGGRRHDEDRSLLDTATRETREETGIELDRIGHVLGRLSHVSPRIRRAPGLVVAAFVYAVPPDAAVAAESPEVAEAFWIPLARFRSDAARTIHHVESSLGPLAFPAFHVGPDRPVVWGLTYRILSELLDRIG